MIRHHLNLKPYDDLVVKSSSLVYFLMFPILVTFSSEYHGIHNNLKTTRDELLPTLPISRIYMMGLLFD